jgi:hypothetical protein
MERILKLEDSLANLHRGGVLSPRYHCALQIIVDRLVQVHNYLDDTVVILLGLVVVGLWFHHVIVLYLNLLIDEAIEISVICEERPTEEYDALESKYQYL